MFKLARNVWKAKPTVRIALMLFGSFVVIGSVGLVSQATGNWQRGVIASYNHETYVQDAKILSPTNLEQLAAAVREASAKGARVRVAGASHSISSIIRSDGVYIRTNRLNQIEGLEQNERRETVVSVQAGVTLGELHRYLAARGLSLGFAFPFYHGVTIGGLLATGSHGSSRRHVAISSQLVDEMTIVNGLGEAVVVNERNPELLKAAKVNLGLLGVVYRVKLKVRRDFNIRFHTEVLENESALLGANGRVNWGPVADSEFLAWFPNDNRAIRFVGTITNERAEPGAALVILRRSSKTTPADYLAKKALDLSMHSPQVAAVAENRRYQEMVSSPPFVRFKDGVEERVKSTVGPSSTMLLSRPHDLNQAYTFQDLSFSFPLDQAAEVLTTIRNFSQKTNLRYPIVGIFMRFGRSGNDNYLSHVERPGQRKGRVYVLAEFGEVKDYDGPNGSDTTSWAVKQRNALMQLLIKKHHVGLHWGKNLDHLFQSGMIPKIYGSNVNSFMEQVREMDPKGIFSNRFMDGLLNKSAMQD